MMPKFAPQLVDRIYSDADIYEFWSMLGIIERHVELPPASWMFCHLFEWMSCTRSGIWTYYEAMPDSEQQKVLALLKMFPVLDTLAEQYSKGKMCWHEPEAIAQVDAWIFANEREMESMLLKFARTERSAVEKLIFSE